MGKFEKGHKGFWLGKKSPQNRQIEFTCVECGKKYFKAQNRKSETKTCSNKCRAIYAGKLNTGSNNWIWKNDRVGYFALHNWIKRHKGKANICSNTDCVYPRKDIRGRILLKPGGFHWANISGEYKRELDDWFSLCISCHREYDKNRDSIKKNFDSLYKRL